MNDRIKSQIEFYISIDTRGLEAAGKILIKDLHEKVLNFQKKQINKKKLYFAHYTSLETVYSILTNYQRYPSSVNGLRSYDAYSLNDQTEGKLFDNELKKTSKTYEVLKKADKTTNIFICSFVASNEKGVEDKLAYWQSYGQDGLGCSILLSPGYKHNEILKYVNYEKPNNIQDCFKEYFILGNKLYNKFKKDSKDKKDFGINFCKQFDSIRFLYKNNDYKNENEYRFIKVNLDNKDIKYDFKKEGPYLRKYISTTELQIGKILTSGSKVVIGPRVQNSERICQYLGDFAKQLDIHTEFIISPISYRKVW